MGFFDRNPLGSRAAAELSYDGRFKVADEKLWHAEGCYH